MLDHGGTIFEAEPVGPRGRSGADQADLEALRQIFLFVNRSNLELAVSAASVREAHGDSRRVRWVLDVLDYTQAWLAESPERAVEAAQRARRLDDPFRFRNVSVKDRQLLRDALALDCDVFLTVERRLATQAEHLYRALGLLVMRPPELRNRMWPYAGLL